MSTGERNVRRSKVHSKMTSKMPAGGVTTEIYEQEDESWPSSKQNPDTGTSVVLSGKRQRDYSYEEIKKLKRQEANRKSAAVSRQRRLNLIDELKKSVHELSSTVKELTKENDEIRREIKLNEWKTMAITSQMGLLGAPGPPMCPPGVRHGFLDDHGAPASSVGTRIRALHHLDFSREMHASDLGENLVNTSVRAHEQPTVFLAPGARVVQYLQNLPLRDDSPGILQPQASQPSTSLSYNEIKKELERQQQQLSEIKQSLQAGHARNEADAPKSNSSNSAAA